MAIEWSKSLSTGVEWQDSQHKELFKRINSLLDAMSLGMGKDELFKLFKFLDEYFVFHFGSEEHAMRKYDYPATDHHLGEHMSFVEDVARLKEESLRGVSTGLVIKAQRRVVDWLINHIGGDDKSLGEFIIKAESGKGNKGAAIEP